jgi:hypothetical protein
MGVNLWLAADGVDPAKPGTGARVALRFTDATGHLVREAAVVGDGIHPELQSGTYGWKQVAGQATAPEGACWMVVYLGADASTGTVRFDDVHIDMRNPLPPRYPAAGPVARR